MVAHRLGRDGGRARRREACAAPTPRRLGAIHRARLLLRPARARPAHRRIPPPSRACPGARARRARAAHRDHSNPFHRRRCGSCNGDDCCRARPSLTGQARLQSQATTLCAVVARDTYAALTRCHVPLVPARSQRLLFRAKRPERRVIRPHPPRHTDPEVRPRSPPDRSEALNSRQSERRAHHQITRCAERTSKQAERRQRNTCLHAKKEEPVLAGLELRPAAPWTTELGNSTKASASFSLPRLWKSRSITRPSAQRRAPRMCAIRTSGWSTRNDRAVASPRDGFQNPGRVPRAAGSRVVDLVRTRQRRPASPAWLVTQVERKPPSAGRAAGLRLLVCTRSSDVGSAGGVAASRPGAVACTPRLL